MLMKKNKWKKEDNKRKKDKHDNLGDNEKEQLRKYEKEGKKVMHDITLMILKKQKWKKRTTKKKKHNNLDDNKRDQMKKEDNKRKKKGW